MGGFTPMHPNVGVALDLWLTGIKDLRNVRKNELANLSEIPHLHNGSKSHLQGDICSLIACVKELTKHTRSARTIVWCALQMLYASIPSGSSSGEWAIRITMATSNTHVSVVVQNISP